MDDGGVRLCNSIGYGTSIFYVHCDVTKEDDVSRAVDETVARFGSLDIMVNNAGLSGPPCPDIRDVKLEDFEKVFDINVKGVFIGMKHAARVMMPSRKGTIVSLCSVVSVVGGVGPHPYTGSKHAVLGLTRSVAAELGKHGIRVNCVSPYAVLTGLALAHLPEDERTEDTKEGFRAFVTRNANLSGVELTKDDVANAVLFLASDEAKYISGANLVMGGSRPRIILSEPSGESLNYVLDGYMLLELDFPCLFNKPGALFELQMQHHQLPTALCTV